MQCAFSPIPMLVEIRSSTAKQGVAAADLGQVMRSCFQLQEKGKNGQLERKHQLDPTQDMNGYEGYLEFHGLCGSA